jgi:protein-L-isoaspartate(D-aspartate) O-methyltransferase
MVDWLDSALGRAAQLARFVLCAGPVSLALLAGAALAAEPAVEEKRSEPDWKAMRERMVSEQIEARGVRNPRVLQALRDVPRHHFVPDTLRGEAYRDHPLPIGARQTISQPYVVAAMTEALDPQPGDRVLEIGTGSGYQAAVLSKLVERVYSIEIIEELGLRARAILAKRGYDNVEVSIGDGFRGLPEHAPFDGIIVTAAPEEVPPPLLEQLAPGARLVIPVGGFSQDLRVIERTGDGTRSRSLFPVRFVPMTGEAQAQ